ncbi:unnamed protein product [Owenia fusiformis]|uniref:Uncharacterized protein n=1 Tax=Owenia fusiformis TaxID=6347 RepID=A0A8J1TY12_OWEFU|nr:unnamed protein product [Owenia fusiformis]
MNFQTLLVCIVAVAVIPEFVRLVNAGKKEMDVSLEKKIKGKTDVLESTYAVVIEYCEYKYGICRLKLTDCKKNEEKYNGNYYCAPHEPYCCVPTDDEKPPSGEGLSSSEPEPAGISSGLHSGCFIMYTLTSKGTYSGTDALFKFKFYRWMTWYWQSSPWKLENNAGDDREEGHWDLYGGYPQGIGGLPADWIYVRQTTRFYDRWQIKTIFMKDVCHKKLYDTTATAAGSRMIQMAGLGLSALLHNVDQNPVAQVTNSPGFKIIQ